MSPVVVGKPDKWEIVAHGHSGEIDAKSTSYQILYFKSNSMMIPPPEMIITIENDGPSDLQVWVDRSYTTGLDPLGETPPIMPDLIIKKDQSSSVSAVFVVLVRTPSSSAKGNFVISWCCPPSGLSPEAPSGG
ncbi:MAG TPA: hypothetical protein PLY09_11205 [Methanothrix sp.]|nr:hypothetical protein [Methanothrix sp.]HPJ85313.1 hypothetical protein [Methanothrix sp.]